MNPTTVLDQYTALCESRRARVEAMIDRLAAMLGVSREEAGRITLLQAAMLADEMRRGK